MKSPAGCCPACAVASLTGPSWHPPRAAACGRAPVDRSAGPGDDAGIGTREVRPELGGRREQRPGLLAEDVEVVLDGVAARRRTDRLADLAGDQPGEGPGLQAHREGAEVGEQVGGPGEQEVA